MPSKILGKRTHKDLKPSKAAKQGSEDSLEEKFDQIMKRSVNMKRGRKLSDPEMEDCRVSPPFAEQKKLQE